MKILILTNDVVDCFVSRIPLAKHLSAIGNNEVHIYTHLDGKAAPKYCIDFRCKRNIIEYIKAFRAIPFSNYDAILFRGIELTLASVFMRRRNNSKNIYLLSGLGRAFMIKGWSGGLIRSVYKVTLMFIQRWNRGIFIVQNRMDSLELLPLKTILIQGSGVARRSEKLIPKLISEKVLIFVAFRFIPSKGYKDVLRLAEIIKKFKQIGLIIAGDYEILSQREIDLISRLNDFENIEFLGYKEDLTRYYERCHVAWLPTRYREGVPRFLIEALSYGMIISTSKAPGCAELFSNENGFEYINVEDFLVKIMNLSLNKLKFSEMSRKSIELFESSYSSDVVFEHYARLLKV